MAEENMTEDQKLRLLREEVVTLRVEAPKIMLRLLEQAKQHKMQNMKNAEYTTSPLKKLEKKPDFWMPSPESFEIAETKHSLEKQIELNAACDDLLECLKWLKESKKNY